MGMKNYERMVALNRTVNKEKVSRALQAIDRMQAQHLQVTVGELSKRTGLSRGFFYKNEEVRKELEAAQNAQKGKTFVRPQQVILNQAMEQQLRFLERKIDKLIEENRRLQEENLRLRKDLHNCKSR